MERGKGSHEKTETELASKEDADKKPEDEEDSNKPSNNAEGENKELNDDDENEELNDDQVDPYHGQNQPEEEPEAMDLPEDMQLDEDAKDEKDNQEDNPFDLDAADKELPEGFDEEEDNDVEKEKPEDLSDEENEADKLDEEISIETPQLDQDKLETAPDEQEDASMEVDPSKDEGEDQNEEEQQKTVDTNSAEASKAQEEDDNKPEPSAVPASKSDENGGTEQENKDKEQQPIATQEEETPSKSDEQAAGQVESKDGLGHEGKSAKQENQESSESRRDSEDSSRRPGETDSKRSLADNSDTTKDQLKRLKTMDMSKDAGAEPMEEDNNESSETSAEVFQHIQSAEKNDALTVDNATKDQLEKQKGMQMDDEKEKSENPKLNEDEEGMEVDEMDVLEEIAESEIDKNPPDLIRGLPENKKKLKNKSKNSENKMDEEIIEVEGDNVLTLGAQRPAESYSHTNLELLQKTEAHKMSIEQEVIDLTVDSSPVGNETGALIEWHDLESRTLSLSQELCEQLRLVLEPTQAARLKGDYKTGKRLNMRKVIPYIASGFRKDKIWLRRTQPSKREYQILLALDDSASMLDNKSKQVCSVNVAH